MKNIILLALLVTLVTVSCNQKSTETTTTKTSVSDTTKITNEPTTAENGTTMMKKDTVIVQKVTEKVVAEKIYSCPMHPEVQGKLNSKCSKCGMPLTEPVS